MTKTIGLVLALSVAISGFGQDKEGGFRPENLFTGGSISLGFGSNSFQIGGSPFLGYSLSSWIDAGIVANYNYNSFRTVYTNDDKLRSSTYGGGLFTRIYPINFLFVHAQFEHNFINEKYIPAGGGAAAKNKVEANSFLVGAGYATGRYPGSGQPFFYLSILFDVLNSEYSPYANASGSVRPILRGGVQVPLFQGKRR